MNKDKLTEEELIAGLDLIPEMSKFDTKRKAQIKEIVREHFGTPEGKVECPLCGALYDDSKSHREQRQQKPTVTRREIENAVGDTSDEYTEGVIELFEEKGFTVEE